MKTDSNIVLFDDTWYYINIGDDDFKCLHYSEYKECIIILLSEKQQDQYSGDYKREFNVSDKRIEKFKQYISNNYWREHNGRTTWIKDT
jgi:hypothetical protein